MNRIVCIVVFLTMALAIAAQNYTRPLTHSAKKSAQRREIVAVCDTVVPSFDSVIVSGFEKPLRSMRESMFVSNATSRDINSIDLTIDYLDMKGRGLHQATHSVDIEIPAGETRRIEVRAFDRSSLFYYHLSPVPPRAKHATPFNVKVTIKYVTHPKNSDK